MKKLSAALWLACVFFTALCANAQDAQQKPDAQKELDAPIPNAAHELVKRAIYLAERDKTQESIATLQKAIAAAPNYVNAHAEYIRMKGIFLNRYDEVRAEYENLMAQEPNNPVYPMALAAAPHQSSSAGKTWYKKVVELAPGWAWAHYAEAFLVLEKQPQTAADELLKYLDEDGTLSAAYWTLSFIQEKRLKRIDEAIRTAGRMVAHPDFRPEGLSMLWRLRFGKTGTSEAEKSDLRKELSRLATDSRDIKVLDAVRLAYLNLFGDKEKAEAVESKIRQLDWTWYRERGRVLFVGTRNVSGIFRLVVAVNRQYAILNKMNVIGDETEPNEKLRRLEKILTLRPNAETKRYIYERIFSAAEKAGNTNAIAKYGRLLYEIDRTDAVLPSKIGLALSRQRKDLRQALQYARLAERDTRTFRRVSRPANDGLTDAEWEKERFSEAEQRQHYKKVRALALDALGWVLCQTGNCGAAETKLRESVKLYRTEQNLWHLSGVLEKLGRKKEAEKCALESRNEYARSLRESFRNEPAKDFELTGIDGRKVKLSDLKGKVVLLDFWATWCGPCTESVPTLNKLYEKYKGRGFEILYVSTDAEADLPKVAPFAKDNKINFLVLFDRGAKELYNVSVFPTTIFIDKQGKIRYRDVGFVNESARKYDVIINELLEAKPDNE